MTTQTTETRRMFAGFASYESFLRNDPYYYASTKWHRRLRKKRLRCRPFSLQQIEGLFVVHDTQSELLLTRLSVDLTPWHLELPDHPLFRHLYEHNILAYDRRQLEQSALNSEVEERLCGLILFEAGEDLEQAISALDVRVYAPTKRSSWLSWHSVDWRLDAEPGQ